MSSKTVTDSQGLYRGSPVCASAKATGYQQLPYLASEAQAMAVDHVRAGQLTMQRQARARQGTMQGQLTVQGRGVSGGGENKMSPTAGHLTELLLWGRLTKLCRLTKSLRSASFDAANPVTQTTKTTKVVGPEPLCQCQCV